MNSEFCLSNATFSSKPPFYETLSKIKGIDAAAFTRPLAIVSVQAPLTCCRSFGQGSGSPAALSVVVEWCYLPATEASRLVTADNCDDIYRAASALQIPGDHKTPAGMGKMTVWEGASTPRRQVHPSLPKSRSQKTKEKRKLLF